jgi:GTP cyclohydrolase I
MGNDEQSYADAVDAVRTLLEWIGEDPNREGLRETPARVVRSLADMTAGLRRTPEGLFKTFEDGTCDEMVLLTGIEFQSLCEHHLLPFIGEAHVAYLPRGRIIGISKLARLVELYAARPQVQERLTVQVTAALDKNLEPKGSACVVEAKHLCMVCRGVRKQNATMVTSSLTGAFKYDPATRAELFRLIRRR